jgi:two-component system, NtrC family, response regulator HydG
MGMEAKILIADDERHVAEGLQLLLSEEGYTVDTATDGNAAWEMVQSGEYGLVLADLRMPQVDGLELFSRMRSDGIASEIIIITGAASVDSAVTAVKQGAFYYLEKPLKIDSLKILIQKALESYGVKQENRLLEERLSNMTRFGDLIGQSEEMKQVYSIIEAAAPTNASILIAGESGTGKELVARAVHDKSSRSKGPFVPINCAAFPREILENELFGHEKGAFTGALNEKPGCFELASGGTLFLDEVADLSAVTQPKILRVLQEGEFERLGGTRSLRVDVRLVAASNRDLTQMVRDKRFREDLFYRLNVITVHVPPLRERREDIPVLAQHFLRVYAAKNNRRLDGLTDDALRRLEAYAWPGNVRELQNVIEHAVVLLEPGCEIQPDDLPFIDEVAASASGWTPTYMPEDGFDDEQYHVARERVLSRFEQGYLRWLVDRANANMSRAAKLAGVDRTTLYRLMEKHGLRRDTIIKGDDE